MRRRLWFLVAGLLLVGSACAHGGGVALRPDDQPARVEVTNNAAFPIHVFVMVSGVAHWLGTVQPGIAGHLTIPPTMIGQGAVELRAGAFRSGPLLLAPGRVVDLVIGTRSLNSTATVRP